MLCIDIVCITFALEAQIIASEKLAPYEPTPVSIIATAIDLARSQRDVEGTKGVVLDGLMLLAKWHRYLAIQNMHPDLAYRGDPRAAEPLGQ